MRREEEGGGFGFCGDEEVDGEEFGEREGNGGGVWWWEEEELGLVVGLRLGVGVFLRLGIGIHIFEERKEMEAWGKLWI